MKIYVTRHGETDWNHLNHVLGRPDIPLNDTGRKQADHLADRLEDTSLDAIYASPLKRAYQTAEAVQVRRPELQIQTEPRLIEQSFGIFEGKSRDDQTYQKEKHEYFKPFENGESFLDVAARVYPFLDELIAAHDNDDSILLVTHGGIGRIIANYFEGMDNEQFASFFMPNCETLLFEFDKNKPYRKGYNASQSMPQS